MQCFSTSAALACMDFTPRIPGWSLAGEDWELKSHILKLWSLRNIGLVHDYNRMSARNTVKKTTVGRNLRMCAHSLTLIQI